MLVSCSSSPQPEPAIPLPPKKELTVHHIHSAPAAALLRDIPEPGEEPQLLRCKRASYQDSHRRHPTSSPRPPPAHLAPARKEPTSGVRPRPGSDGCSQTAVLVNVRNIGLSPFRQMAATSARQQPMSAQKGHFPKEPQPGPPNYGRRLLSGARCQHLSDGLLNEPRECCAQTNMEADNFYWNETSRSIYTRTRSPRQPLSHRKPRNGEYLLLPVQASASWRESTYFTLHQNLDRAGKDRSSSVSVISM